jgi:GT2 family glycosyltransferase
MHAISIIDEAQMSAPTQQLSVDCHVRGVRTRADEGAMPRIAIVVIARNEGDRLRRCLESALRYRATVVYVDSGSTDGSVALAHELGVHVVELDMRIAFSAARARNAGRRVAARLNADVKYIQFIDGDCEFLPGWIDAAVEHLEAHDDVAAVCGHLRERHPEASIYNRLCAMEWRATPGETFSTGGIFMVRATAFDEVGGLRDSMVAGEEPEMCWRLREREWHIWRLDVPMATHDAAMMRFAQWWKRAVRSGHGYAELAWLHRHSPTRPWRREVLRNWFWGLGLPVMILLLAWPTSGASMLLISLYPLWIAKIAHRRIRTVGENIRDGVLYGTFCMIGKFAGAIGQWLFAWRQWGGRQPSLFEYKAKPDRGAMRA